MRTMKRSWLPLAVLALGSAAVVQAQDQEARMQEALAAAERSAEHKERDRNDKPIEVVQFLGVEDGMTALDVISGGGYWTGVLSAAVGPSGTVYMHSPEFMIERGGEEFLERERQIVERLGNVEPLHGDIGDSAAAGMVDVAITSNNFHDQYNRGGLEAGTAFLEDILAALKPGGVLGLIDHEGAAGQDNATLHRIPLADAKEALEAAGFVVEAESDILANPDDPQTVGVRDPAVSGKTQKILVLARKPN